MKVKNISELLAPFVLAVAGLMLIVYGIREVSGLASGKLTVVSTTAGLVFLAVFAVGVVLILASIIMLMK